MISVIIPYNRDRGYLFKAIKSIQNQSYEDWEIIHAQSDKSLGYNVNWGVKQSKGEYIKILAEDDELTPDCLYLLLKGIKGLDWVCADAVNFDHEREYPMRMVHPNLERMLIRNEIHGGTTLYRRELFDLYKGWDETLVTGEEYDWHLMLMSNKRTVKHIPEIVYRYRLHEAQKSVYHKGFKTKADRHKYIEGIKNRYK